MEKPNLNRMWETFIRIGLPSEISYKGLFDTMRFNIYPMISDLKQKKIINWYHFLIHNGESGVPTTEDDKNFYFHIRFVFENDINIEDEKDITNFLPDYCVMTRRIRRERVESISGIDKSLLRNEEIEEAWRIIGEQSVWLLEMLNIHKKDVAIPPQQIRQFLHFYANMTQLQVR